MLIYFARMFTVIQPESSAQPQLTLCLRSIIVLLRHFQNPTSDEADSAILDLLDSGHELNVLDFGEDGSYFVSYD